LARNRPKVKFELSRLAIGLGSAALAFALVWMFGLGVFMGRRHSPDTYIPPPPPRPVAAPVQAPGPPPQAPAPPVRPQAAAPAQAPKPPAQPAPAQPPQPQAKTQARGAPQLIAARPPLPAAAHPAEKFALDLAQSKRQAADKPADPKKGDKAAAQQAKEAPKPAYVAQVGAFSDQARAQALLADLVKAGYRGHIFTGQAQPRFRIRLGPYAKRQEAEKAAGAVGTKLGLKPYLLEVPASELPEPVKSQPEKKAAAKKPEAKKATSKKAAAKKSDPKKSELKKPSPKKSDEDTGD
jgi:cell division septation protein DedD